MTNQYVFESPGRGIGGWTGRFGLDLSRRAVVALILVVALFAFEVFNFDTTRYALTNLMGEVKFLGFQWAAILAIAFCSIDFAGLVRLFTPEKGREEPKEVWYLMGAWLLGATMNALMTWWAVSLTLLNHEFGNEVLSREQLLQIVPVFVAVLVWLTRILFIGAFTVAGEHIFDLREWRSRRSAGAGRRHRPKPMSSGDRKQRSSVLANRPRGAAVNRNGGVAEAPSKTRSGTQGPSRSRGTVNSRIRQRPPMPLGRRKVPHNGVHARNRN